MASLYSLSSLIH